MSLKFVKNIKTGVVFAHTDRLAARKDMAPCDAKGRQIYPEPEVEEVQKPAQKNKAVEVAEPAAPVEKKAKAEKAAAFVPSSN